MKAKLRKTYNIIIKLLIFIITAYFLYDQIFYKRDIETLLSNYQIWNEQKYFYPLLFTVIALIFVNLGIEAAKWKLLMTKLENISFLNAYKAVLTGIATSMFLPNRTGDYLGRVFVLKKANRIQATLSTILGSLAQFITTIIFGLIAVVILFPQTYPLTFPLHLWLYVGIILIALTVIVLLIFIYVEFSAFTVIIKSITGKEYQKIKKYAEVFSWYSSHDLFKILGMSILRYLVFSFQFFLLLITFGIEINYFHAMVLIGMVYLIMTIIPTIALSELGVRGSVSLYVFKPWLINNGAWTAQSSLGILSATTSLWLFNIALPAVLGVFFIFGLNFFRKGKNP
jgi:uncharacterized membrane protein YbhN (UPF0104 family)